MLMFDLWVMMRCAEFEYIFETDVWLKLRPLVGFHPLDPHLRFRNKHPRLRWPLQSLVPVNLASDATSSMWR